VVDSVRLVERLFEFPGLLGFVYVASISISTSLAILSRVRSPELEM
jgi:hypothetical protein